MPFALPVGAADLRDAGSIDRLETEADGELAVLLQG